MMRFAIWLATIWFAFGASASTAKLPKAVKRKPASEAYEMRVSVVFGERSTQFFVTSSGNDGLLKISNDRGLKGKKELDESEIELLLQTYTKLPAGNNVPDSCYRSRMDIVMVRSGQPQQVKASCFAVESPTEAAFRHFANLLAQPF
jgi:hypothetical protein